MGRTLIHPPGANRERSLGWLALWWIETFVVQGPGDVEGEPIVHGDEYSGFIVDCYALDANGRRLVNSAFFSRPKGTNKSGLAAEVALFEALGPARFDGWAEGGETFEMLGQVYTYQEGEPMGRYVTHPLIRIMATEEDQTGNVYDMVYGNCLEGPLSQLKAYGMEVGKGKILLPHGGSIMPSSSGAASKDGGKETFVVFDESHLYNTNGLRNMYKTVTRNLVKRRKSAETWYIETTTMYAPGENSVAEATYEYAHLIKEGKIKRSKMLYDHRWGDVDDLSDEEALTAAIIEAYGEAMTWNSLDGVVEDIFDVRRSEIESRRYFLNALTQAENAWIEPHLVSLNTFPKTVKPGEQITIGFDGALTSDATALVGCRVSDGFLWPILVAECPDGPAGKDWMVDTLAFDAAVAGTFEDYDVVGFYADPPFWTDYLDKWELEFGETLKVSANNRSKIKWWTKRDQQMSAALDRLYTALKRAAKTRQYDDGAPITVTLSPSVIMKRHFLNARKWPRRGGVVIGKDNPSSTKKIDTTMAAALAYEARANFLFGGEEEEEETWVPRRIN